MTTPHLFAVLGCQRCGTTLLGSILNAHPHVRYYEEDGQWPIRVYRNREYATNTEYGTKKQNIGFKLTTLSPETDRFKANDPSMRFLFTTRNILDVCSSMEKLGWIRPDLLGEELQISINHLYPSPYKDWTSRKFIEYDYNTNSHKLAALYAQTRFNLIREYYYQKLEYIEINYERLASEPAVVAKEMCEFLDIEWHPDMLMYHRNTNGRIIHGTNSRRKIDSESVAKYRNHLSGRQIDDVLSISHESRDLATSYYACYSQLKMQNNVAKAVDQLLANVATDKIMVESKNPFFWVNVARALSEREEVIVYCYNNGSGFDFMAKCLNTDMGFAKREVGCLMMKNKRLDDFYRLTGSVRKTIQRAHLLA